MALNEKEQILQSIEKGRSFLITFKQPSFGQGFPRGGDGVASSLAFWELLQKMGKQADIVSPDFVLSKIFEFLPNSSRIASDIRELRRMIIGVDISKNPVQDFSYDTDGGKLNIFLTPKNGLLDARQVEIKHEDFRYDSIFVLDTHDLESLGGFYGKYSELFCNIPIINIDHSPLNEHFGNINFLDINRASTAEMIYEIFKACGESHLTEDAATCLLAGIIAKTKNFRSGKIGPTTLFNTSALIEAGGRREEVARNFYGGREIPVLKLWGRALARLKSLPEKKLVWTLLARQDFIHCGADDECLEDIIEELITTSPMANVIVLLYEKPDAGGERAGVCGILYVNHNYSALELLKNFTPVGAREIVRFCLSQKNLIEAEKEVIGVLTSKIANENT